MSKKRTRSPNYPALDLADAIERVEMVYEAQGRVETDDESVAVSIGYNSLNGTSRGRISALRKYGLLEPGDEGLRVSDDALAIIELPPEDPEHAAALERAAFRPALFAELRETYGDDLPDDRRLRHFLIQKNFNPRTADEVIRLYRNTVEFVSLHSEEYTPAEDLIEDPQEAQQMQQRVTDQRVPASTDGGSVSPDSEPRQQDAAMPTTFLLQFRPTENSEARIELRGDVTQEAIDTIGRVLNTIKGSPAKDQQPGQSETEPSTEQLAIGDGSDGPI